MHFSSSLPEKGHAFYTSSVATHIVVLDVVCSCYCVRQTVLLAEHRAGQAHPKYALHNTSILDIVSKCQSDHAHTCHVVFSLECFTYYLTGLLPLIELSI